MEIAELNRAEYKAHLGIKVTDYSQSKNNYSFLEIAFGDSEQSF